MGKVNGVTRSSPAMVDQFVSELLSEAKFTDTLIRETDLRSTAMIIMLLSDIRDAVERVPAGESCLPLENPVKTTA